MAGHEKLINRYARKDAKKAKKLAKTWAKEPDKGHIFTSRGKNIRDMADFAWAWAALEEYQAINN